MAKNDIFLGLDIGSSSVKSIIARRLENDALELLGHGTYPTPAGAVSSGVIENIPAVVSACEKSISLAESEAGLSAKRVVVGLANDFVKTSTSRIRYRRSAPDSPISDEEISAILEKVQSSARAKAKSDLALEMDNSTVDVVLLNSCITSLLVDGEKTENLVGSLGEVLTIEYYTSFAPSLHTSAIEKICADLGLELLTIAVEPFALCRACLGKSDSTPASMILLDIGEETTSAAVIDSSGIRGTSSFSMGARAISRDISLWLSGVNVALSELENVESFPSRIYLCGGLANSPEVQESLALEDWYKGLPFSRRPIINLLDISSLPGIKNSMRRTAPESHLLAIGLTRVALDATSSLVKPSASEPKFLSRARSVLKNTRP